MMTRQLIEEKMQTLMVPKMTTRESKKMEHKPKRRKRCRLQGTIMPNLTRNQPLKPKLVSLRQRKQ